MLLMSVATQLRMMIRCALVDDVGAGLSGSGAGLRDSWFVELAHCCVHDRRGGALDGRTSRSALRPPGRASRHAGCFAEMRMRWPPVSREARQEQYRPRGTLSRYGVIDARARACCGALDAATPLGHLSGTRAYGSRPQRRTGDSLTEYAALRGTASAFMC